MATYVYKLELGGLYLDPSVTASTYVGDITDIWADASNPALLRRGDGSTPGGHVIGGSGFSGSYNDLVNLPTIPTDIQQLTDVNNLLGNGVSGFDGSFGSLTGIPSTTAGYNITDAFSGDYNDLTNKPVIPTIPTTNSSFTNDSGYITSADLNNLSIDLLQDVDTTTPPTNGQVLVWNSTTNVWEPGTVATSNAPENLDDLNDVTYGVVTLDSSNGGGLFLGWSQADNAWRPLDVTVDWNLVTNKPTIPADVSDLTDTTNLLGGGISNVVEDTTPQLGGNLDAQTFDITTTGKILYSNVYSAEGDLPSASTYHGMFAHVHGTGKGYFAHGGNWIPLANESQLYTDSDVATYLNGNLNSHIIPDTNSTYDIGSAEYKIRHLYLSSSSLKFVDGTNTEYSMGVNATGNKLEYNSETVSTSSYETNDITGAIDITKRHHFISGGVNYILADGTYIGQELHFWRSAVGTGYSDITIANAKWTIPGDTTDARTDFVWRTSGANAADNRTFMAVWDGAGWCLSGGTEAV